MNLEPLHNEPALFAADIKALMVADLHIGIEYEMLTAGARIPGKTGEMNERLFKMLDEYKASRLIILGDLKHNLPTSSLQEARDIPRLIEELFEAVDKIDLVPGNHDGGIRNHLPGDVKVHSSRGAVIEGLGMWHGHTWPSEKVMASETVVMAHSHPVAVFVDGVGGRSTERCWLRGEWSRKKALERYEKLGKGFVMVPAFSDLCGGSYVNEVEPRLLGPVLKNGLADIDNAEMYLLDGTHLGRVADNLVKVER